MNSEDTIAVSYRRGDQDRLAIRPSEHRSANAMLVVLLMTRWPRTATRVPHRMTSKHAG
jgi:hypothetical protein